MLPIHVLKFGGTSLQDASFINQAAGIVAQKKDTARPVVVVSAVAGVTDQLVHLADKVSPDVTEAQALIDQLKQQHLTVLSQLDDPADEQRQQKLEALFSDLQTVFTVTEKKNRPFNAWRDEVLSFGERASSQLMSAALSQYGQPNHTLDAHQFIKTDASFGEANVLPELTQQQIRRALASLEKIPVITGFTGSTSDNQITTLGRSGSDYTASLIADALEADNLEIWTDVDGVLTAHPDVVPAAQSINRLNFDDIAELAEHGVGVIHPKTIRPIRNRDISLQVRNSYNLDHPGTQINKTFASNGDFRSVTVTGPFVYVQLKDEYAQTLSSILEEHEEYQKEGDADPEAFSYTRSSRYEPAQFLIRKPLFDKIAPALQQWSSEEDIRFDIHENIYKVKKFTNQLKQSDESFTQLTEVLHQKKIRPLKIGREHNQRHIHLLLPQEKAYEAARAINQYWVDGRKTISLFIAGTGAVGGTLIEQLSKLESTRYNLEVIGTCNSKQVQWLSPAEKEPTDWAAILQELAGHQYPNTIFVDATGSKEVARLYPQLFAADIHVATPSKLANTFEQSFYDRLHYAAAQNNAHFRYETTVGAGLPVISTLHDLLDSGDTVSKISGVVSGTMTYLFKQLEDGLPFSEAIIKARELGYAEPDPRDDLSGEDVARKFLTLARTLGHKIERKQLQVESLVPRELLNVNRSTFLARLPEYNELWEERFAAAKSRDETLRYIGILEKGEISIKIQSVPLNSPLGLLKETDNLIQIFSNYYNQTPLVIQGAGAGKKVTAAGVLSDIFKIVKSLG